METASPGYSHTFGIPAARVGWLIARARTKANLDEKSLAVSVGVRKRLVRRWERGDQIPADVEVESIAAACGIDVATLLPSRDLVEFDRASRFLRVGSSLVSVAELHNDAILTAYVDLVRDQRGVLPGRAFKVRGEDLDVLARALDLDDIELEQRLVRIIGLSPPEASELRRQIVRRRMAMPAAGLLMSGVGLFGAHLAGAESGRPSPVTTVAIESAIATPATTITLSPSVTSAAAAPEPTISSPTTAASTPLDVVVPDATPATVAPEPAAASGVPAGAPTAAGRAPAPATSARPAAPAPQVAGATTIEAPAAVRVQAPPSTAAPDSVPNVVDPGATSITNPGH